MKLFSAVDQIHNLLCLLLLVTKCKLSNWLISSLILNINSVPEIVQISSLSILDVMRLRVIDTIMTSHNNPIITNN